MSKEDYIITEKDYIAWCKMCTLADVMKDCKNCKFNVGLKYRKENEMKWNDGYTKTRKAVANFRNEEKINYENVLDEFLYFLKEDYEEELTSEQEKFLQKAISHFLGYTIKDVEKGEKELLKRWKDSVSL